MNDEVGTMNDEVKANASIAWFSFAAHARVRGLGFVVHSKPRTARPPSRSTPAGSRVGSELFLRIKKSESPYYIEGYYLPLAGCWCVNSGFDHELRKIFSTPKNAQGEAMIAIEKTEPHIR